MKLEELVQVLRKNGVVGAGGAGFPSYAKLDQRADTIILNCAECEPLLKLHRQVLEKYAFEIMSTLDVIREAVGAKRVCIGVKGSYRKTVNAVKAHLDSFPGMEISILPEMYPAGDEVVLIYEALGRIVPPGSLPISVGVTVFNVETILNAYYALKEEHPVVYKYVTVAGAVRNPITVKAPLGMTMEELVELAGGATVEEYALIGGGPMTGPIVNGYDTVTKTTNGLLVFPEHHPVVQKQRSSVSIDLKRAMSACCQCQLCTSLCSRNLLGHPIEPHMLMRNATSGVTKDVTPYINSMFCSQCGICEMYACDQGLSPRKLLGAYKAGLRAAGVKPPVIEEEPVAKPEREYRRIPMARLKQRLGLQEYDLPAPLDDELVKADRVKISLRQHIGAPAVATVKVNDTVEVGQVIGEVAADKLGVAIHASISGVVIDVNENFVMIQKKEK